MPLISEALKAVLGDSPVPTDMEGQLDLLKRVSAELGRLRALERDIAAPVEAVAQAPDQADSAGTEPEPDIPSLNEALRRVVADMPTPTNQDETRALHHEMYVEGLRIIRLRQERDRLLTAAPTAEEQLSPPLSIAGQEAIGMPEPFWSRPINLPFRIPAVRGLSARNIAIAVVAALFLWYVWPTPFVIMRRRDELVRINRFTGNAELIELRGPGDSWRP